MVRRRRGADGPGLWRCRSAILGIEEKLYCKGTLKSAAADVREASRNRYNPSFICI